MHAQVGSGFVRVQPCIRVLGQSRQALGDKLRQLVEEQVEAGSARGLYWGPTVRQADG